ncbi:MAG: hypothetical protein AVDCRST_MAG91-2471, partial [uncultured Sphingomonadaceae bacterium]
HVARPLPRRSHPQSGSRRRDGARAKLVDSAGRL